MEDDPRIRDIGSLSMRSDGILHVVFDVDTAPSMEAVAAYFEARNEMVAHDNPPVLIEIIRIPYVERTVRSFFMSELKPPPCRAVVTTDASFRILFRSFQVVDASDVPTELFWSLEPAIEWIKAQTSAP